MTLKRVLGLCVVLVVVVFVAAIALGFGGRACSYACDQRSAEGDLHEYLAKMFPDKTVLGASCVRMDSDGDGYVSCSARVKGSETNATEETLALECAGSFTMQSGCRLQPILQPMRARGPEAP